MNRRIYLIIWSLLLLGLAGSVAAQPVQLEFETLSRETGLSDNVITALVQDDTGFLWIGTQRGLNRYDTHRTRIFLRSLEQEKVLLDDDIRSLAVDPLVSNVLWMGTGRGGVSRYDSKRNEFETFTPVNSTLQSLAIEVVCFDQSGSLWVGTKDAGLHRYLPEANDFEVYRSTEDRTNGLSSDSIQALVASPHAPELLWIGTDEGLSVLDIRSGQFREDLVPSLGEAGTEPLAVSSLASTEEGLWIGTKQGLLYHYDFFSQQITPIATIAKGMVITAILPSQYVPGVLWVGTRGHGLCSVHRTTHFATCYPYEQGTASSIIQRDVITILEDNNGVLWIGTIAGLSRALIKPPRFPKAHMLSGIPNVSSEPTSLIFMLYEAPTQPGIVWVGARGGFYRYNSHTRRASKISTPATPFEYVVAALEDTRGQFWIAGRYADLFLLDRERSNIERYALTEAREVVVHQIYEAPSMPGLIWLATREMGLLVFDIEERRVVDRFSTDTQIELSSAYVWRVQEDPRNPGVLWIATRYGGLNRLDTKTGQSTAYKRQDTARCLPSDDIITVVSTSTNSLWLGTFGSGLVKFDPLSVTCRTYTTKDGLPHTEVASIFPSGKQHLWVATSGGLALFDTTDETFIPFSEKDGLFGRTFHYQAQFQNAQGEIFLGGAGGFNIFHTESIALDTLAPPIVITELRVDGSPHPFDSLASDKPRVMLSHDRNDLEIDFAVLDMSKPTENRFRVQLVGSDKEWGPVSTEPSIRYANLAPGSYTFKVIGSNPDGAWNTEGAALEILINPPFWRAWWFALLVGGIVTGLVVTAYQYRIHQIHRVERARQRIAADLHDDIGSKVSTIALRLDLVQRIMTLSDKDRCNLEDLSQTARGVVDDLRDTVWIVDSEHDRLPDLFMRMEQAAGHMLEGHRYQFTVPEELPEVSLGMEQRRHIYLLFKEALHNILRHSSAQYVDIHLNYKDEAFTLMIADDGVGFDQIAVQAGHGLKTMRMRAKKLNGHLTIESAAGQGTRIHLTVKVV